MHYFPFPLHSCDRFLLSSLHKLAHTIPTIHLGVRIGHQRRKRKSTESTLFGRLNWGPHGTKHIPTYTLYMAARPQWPFALVSQPTGCETVSYQSNDASSRPPAALSITCTTTAVPLDRDNVTLKARNMMLPSQKKRTVPISM